MASTITEDEKKLIDSYIASRGIQTIPRGVSGLPEMRWSEPHRTIMPLDNRGRIVVEPKRHALKRISARQEKFRNAGKGVQRNRDIEEMFRAGATDVEIGQRFGLAARSVKMIRLNRGLRRERPTGGGFRPIAQETKDRALEMLKHGATITEVVTKIGISRALANRIKKKAGLTRPRA